MRVLVASDVIDNGDGTFRYEYAIYNYQSDYNVNGFTVPVPAGVEISDIDFKFPLHHSGDPYSNDSWVVTEDGSSITWSTDEFSQDQNANAIRWASMYSFSFTANAEPATGDSVLDIFRTNSTEVVGGIYVPSGPTNPYDLNDDGIVNGADAGIFFTQWGQGCGNFCDFNEDCIVNSADLGLLFAAWGP